MRRSEDALDVRGFTESHAQERVDIHFGSADGVNVPFRGFPVGDFGQFSGFRLLPP